jgi:hypothetical protein
MPGQYTSYSAKKRAIYRCVIYFFSVGVIWPAALPAQVTDLPLHAENTAIFSVLV